MDPREFDQLVEQAFAKVPRQFRTRMRNVALVVEPEPSRLQLGKLARGGTLLGLYEGRPLTLRSVSDSFTLPDRITIFQGPHERLARSPEHLRQMIEDTVWHEVAHYFGMDERRVRAAEFRRARAAGRKRI
ncbi:MAG TPA: metallopeptidase family protein [Bryobacteraceae bacterium]|jgi:predicted Zn-dependent protease with MMP-like domain|nr:metallopeptidase family protein [Bryobacteraceae bacterium]